MEIIQDFNGNSYIFVGKNAFKSSYDDNTKAVVSKPLEFNDQLNEWEKEQVLKHIGPVFPDGFTYSVIVHSYGYAYNYKYNNLFDAENLANEYYEDNGYAQILTNNPDISPDIVLSGGNVYYIDYSNDIMANTDAIPKEAKLISLSYNQRMYEHYQEPDYSEDEGIFNNN